MSLDALIKQRIRKSGPLSIAEYMELCLMHPDYGYYMRRDPFGVDGDFTTAPEISQIFGELLGMWLAAQWQKQGRGEIALLELGPGRGTLMADMLRATKRVAGFHEALSVYLLEASPVLKQKQWKTLAGKHDAVDWIASLDTLPALPLFFVANEFFDALPIRQFIAGAERMVELDSKDDLQFAPMEGDITEDSPASVEVMKQLAAHVAQHGGAGLIADYGYVGGSAGDSLQALRAHRFHPVLDGPGEADVTAHVDFDALAAAAQNEGVQAFGAVPQGKFLLQIGASQRLMKLCASASEEQKDALMSGFERLISPEQMGELFKVMAVLPAGVPRPEGF